VSILSRCILSQVTKIDKRFLLKTGKSFFGMAVEEKRVGFREGKRMGAGIFTFFAKSPFRMGGNML
jgi:hypothetical protein